MAETVLAKMAVEISANAAKFTAGLNQANSQFKGFTDSINTAGKILTTFGVGFGVGAVIQGVRSVVDIMSTFERTMSEVKAITGATGKEFDDLKKDALELGAATKFSATEVGQLQIAFGRLGFNTQEILDATKATLDLAAATGEDLAKAADVAGSTVRGFGLDASETQRVVDVMAKSFNTTALGLDNFAEAMKFVAPDAAAANVSLEETTALLGILADRGIRGSTAGTSLRKIFSELSKDGRPVNERLAELGKSGLTLAGAFDEVGRTAQTSLLVLAENTAQADALTESFHHVDGEVAKMAKTMSDNLAGDLDQLSGAFEGLILSGGGLLEPLREVVQAVTNVINAFTGLSEKSSEVGKFFKFLSDQLILPIKLLGLLAKASGETAKPLEDNAEKLRAIASTVEAAFASGNIEAYIKALDRNIYKEEIIAEIRKRQAEDLKKQAAALAPQVGLIQAIEDKIKDFEERKKGAFTTSEIAKFNDKIALLREQLELLNSSTNKAATSIDDYKKIIGILNTEFDKTNANDLSRLRILSAQIAGYEEATQRVERFKKSFKDFDTTIKVPDLKGLTDPLKKVQEAVGGISFERLSTASEEVFARFEDGLKKMAVSTKQSTEEISTLFLDFSGVVGSAASGIGQALGNAISGGANFGKALLGVLGGVLVQLGEMLITAGLGIIGFKKALSSLNGYVALAAGIALVAIGTAVGASIKNLGGGGGSAGASTSGSSGSSSPSSTFTRDQAGQQVVLLSGEFRAKGTDLVLVIDKTNKTKQRTG